MTTEPLYLFESVIKKADTLFGDNAFRIYRENKGWSQPQNMVYDAMMLALSTDDISLPDNIEIDVNRNIDILKDFYSENLLKFNGKKQSKTEIEDRAIKLRELINCKCLRC